MSDDAACVAIAWSYMINWALTHVRIYGIAFNVYHSNDIRLCEKLRNQDFGDEKRMYNVAICYYAWNISLSFSLFLYVFI